MEHVELKLKQASVVLGVPPKDLQNFVQFGIVTPRKRRGLYWFDANALLTARCAWYLKQSIGASTEYLVRFSRSLNRGRDLAAVRADVRLEVKLAAGKPAIEILLPLAALSRELEARLPLAVAARDLPRGRKRPGWKAEFRQALHDAAADLPEVSDEDILTAVRHRRRQRRARPDITVVTEAHVPTSAGRR